ncbi:hypothetical protein AA0119_g7889 [Alternaria tenuissima]|uniref:Multiple myeloma tumor-associated protein 2-like N-terminal domain-containing protein n=1 Tax=Alternaria tenuissima TaxID=119927 RepID=A0ABY0G4D6_9PLEO|nr:kinase phosphorylation protein-like protein [Alternaria alternata]RYN96968.1 hypothetical protein AA0119_g7889 [Alternaria tenuissima]RYO12860.1 hypothetical protein AA0121_g8861 [Alternaria tenuissima]
MDLVQTVRKEGSRGGRADFKWEDVKNDAQRENYLGHSLMAPVGRWQQGRDLNWYAKGDEESKEAEAARIKEEKRKLKEAEEDAMLAAMGLPVPVRNNANLTPLGEKAHQADVKDILDEKAKAEEDDDKAKKREKKEQSEDIDTEIAHGRATGGETMVAMTDVDIDREAETISEGKIIQSASANTTSMRSDQGHSPETVDVGEIQGAGHRTRGARGGEIEHGPHKDQTLQRSLCSTAGIIES